MGNKDISNQKQKNKELLETNSLFDNIKSKYILKEVLGNVKKLILLKIIKNNKKLQKRLDIDKNDFKECSEKYTPIVIKIIPTKNIFGKFINISENDEKYFHVYFDDNKNENSRNLNSDYEDEDEYEYGYEYKYRKINYLEQYDTVKEIKIIIDYQIKSLKSLFYECKCIESVYFIKFLRKNIEDIAVQI